MVKDILRGYLSCLIAIIMQVLKFIKVGKKT